MTASDAIVRSLEDLVSVSDGLAQAVIRRDLAAMEAHVAREDELRLQLAALGGGLSSGELATLPSGRIRALVERMRAAARRNAMLIERAWAVDAATLRLLGGIGRELAGDGVSGYAPTPSEAAYVDREA
jgi:hypothetical protein